MNKHEAKRKWVEDLLRPAFNKLGMSTEEFAAQVTCSHSSIKNWLVGASVPNEPNLLLLVRELALPADESHRLCTIARDQRDATAASRLAPLLTELRKGRVQRAVSRQLGLPDSYISQYECARMRPSRATLKKVAELYDIDPADLYAALEHDSRYKLCNLTVTDKKEDSARPRPRRRKRRAAEPKVSPAYVAVDLSITNDELVAEYLQTRDGLQLTGHHIAALKTIAAGRTKPLNPGSLHALARGVVELMEAS